MYGSCLVLGDVYIVFPTLCVFFGHLMIMGIDVTSCGWLCSRGSCPPGSYYHGMYATQIEITKQDRKNLCGESKNAKIISRNQIKVL